MFDRLENLSTVQTEVSNWLLLLAAERASHSSNCKDADRRRREEQIRTFKDKLAPAHPLVHDVKALAEMWWREELIWMASIPEEEQKSLPDMIVYRLMVLALRNHTMCPFVRQEKPFIGKERNVADTDEFEAQNRLLFTEFITNSIAQVERLEHPLKSEIQRHLDATSQVNIDQEHYSARHKLLGKDMAILKSVAIGGTAGVVTSLIAGPAIGTWIGNLAGLSGAAATSFGLALLGGGSLASGGFGMFGGSIVLGVAFGGTKAYWEGAKQGDVDSLTLAMTARNLPILLATGRKLKELGNEDLTRWIRLRIVERANEYRKNLAAVTGEDSEAHQRRKTIEGTLAIMESGESMASTFDWFSMYDAYQAIKSAVG